MVEKGKDFCARVIPDSHACLLEHTQVTLTIAHGRRLFLPKPLSLKIFFTQWPLCRSPPGAPQCVSATAANEAPSAATPGPPEAGRPASCATFILMSPVSTPFSTTSSLATASVMPSSCFTLSTRKERPVDRRTVRTPRFSERPYRLSYPVVVRDFSYYLKDALFGHALPERRIPPAKLKVIDLPRAKKALKLIRVPVPHAESFMDVLPTALHGGERSVAVEKNDAQGHAVLIARRHGKKEYFATRHFRATPRIL